MDTPPTPSGMATAWRSVTPAQPDHPAERVIGPTREGRAFSGAVQPRCSVIAGDFIDDKLFTEAYFRNYVAGTGTKPPSWAWHPYTDGYELTNARIRGFLRLTKSRIGSHAQVWLTEAGPM